MALEKRAILINFDAKNKKARQLLELFMDCLVAARVEHSVVVDNIESEYLPDDYDASACEVEHMYLANKSRRKALT